MTGAKKAILTVYLILIVLCCSLILCCMFGVLNTHFVTDVVNTFLFGSFIFKILYTIIFIILIVVAIFLLFFDFKKPVEKTVKIAAYSNGSVLISIKAIEELVGKYLSQLTSIKENKSKVIPNDDSISVKVDLGVYSETNIPEVTKSINDGLKYFIENQTGLKVQDVDVLIQNIASTAQNADRSTTGANKK